LIEIYDARVDGGFPPPVVPGDCEGESCQPEVPAPQFPMPGSTSAGPGNPPSPPRNPRCPKGKHKVKRGGKVRCVPNKRKQRRHEKQRTQKSGRAER